MYSTWNSAQCYVAAWMGGECGGGRILAYAWLSPFAVYITTLLISSTSMQIKKLKKTAQNYTAHICFNISVQFSSVAQSCLTLCDPMNCSTPGLPVHHQLPEFTQTHVHLLSDAIQPSHPLSSPSPRAPNPSQHQGLFQ